MPNIPDNLPNAAADALLPADMRGDEFAARILESMGDAFFALDGDWRFVYLNTQAERVLSRTRAELLGRNVWNEFPAAVGTLFEAEYRRAAREQVTATFEAYYPAPLNAWYEIRAYPSGEGLSVFFQDITARRAEQEAQAQSEERYRLLVDNAKDYAMILTDPEGRITDWNAGAERILGWTETEALGQSAALIFTPEDCEAGVPAQEMQRAAAGGGALDLRWHIKKDGSRFYADGIMEALRDDTERKALQEQQQRLAEANRLLLDSTGDGIYGVDLEGKLTLVNRAALQMLGYAEEQMVGRNAHQLIHYLRANGLPYPEDECPIFQAMRTGVGVRVDEDVFVRRDGSALPVAYSAAPIVEQGETRGAVVTFYDISERKTLEEERARLAERERNIAFQLQAALTPTLPERIPGMALAKYYEAALAEAAVGGDFYDVFPVEKGCTALVVGDLAGKGLAAAAQVATVRNMLRYALYRARTLVGALEGLNALLVEQGLLTGFATLFIAAYDSAEGTLTYVNAGQEPALLRRAGSDTVEPLNPTGPVVGVDENGIFTEQTIHLAPGDALAIFTDGLTEVGPSRRDMLGVEGVSELMSDAVLLGKSASEQAEAIALRLVAGVDAASRGGVARDDVCVLVGVVERCG